MNEEDVSLLIDGMWNGTKNLISRSKVGQQPRLLLRIVYGQDGFHIGELNKLISFTSEKTEEAIRHVTDGVLQIAPLIQKLEVEREKITRIEYKIDEQLITSSDLVAECTRIGIEATPLEL
jgi:CRISPR-associated protein Csh2